MHAVDEGCKYHDIGRILFPSLMLMDNTESYDMISAMEQLHPYNSHLLVSRTCENSFPSKGHKLLIEDICLYHHEKYDGTGFPSGLKKDQIPLVAELCGMAYEMDLRLYLSPYVEDRFKHISDYYIGGVGINYSELAVKCFSEAMGRVFAFYNRQKIVEKV